MKSSGIINLRKPKGITSFEAVRRIRKHVEGRVGHGGTLDPDAEGVLPILIGKATRIQEFFKELRKTYRARIELGSSTDTYDASGRVTKRGDFSGVREEDVRRALSGFVGEIEQVPPPFSALKFKGRPLYELARRGEDVPLKPRKVHFYDIKLLSFSPPYVDVEVECGGGAYIRSLAHDLGEVLGCGAHLKELVRTRDGPFAIDDALTIDEAIEALEEGYDIIYPPDEVLQHMNAVILKDGRAFGEGRAIKASLPFRGKVRVYDGSGDFLGIGESTGEILKPVKVLKAF